MKKQIAQCRKSVSDFDVSYSLFESEEPGSEDYGKHIGYSFSVEKNDGKCTERAIAADVTSDRTAALRIFNMMVKNDVTPVSLMDIIVDKLY